MAGLLDAHMLCMARNELNVFCRPAANRTRKQESTRGRQVTAAR
jgi:hypothetical protein